MKPNDILQDLPSTPAEKFETDAQKLVRLHLEDENHTITEEEIRNLKVGVDPLPEESEPEAEKE
jgi:hypothetical protein